MQSEYSTSKRDDNPAPEHSPGPPPPPAGPPQPPDGQPHPPDGQSHPPESEKRVPVKMPNVQPLATYILLGLIVLVYLAGQVFPFEPSVIKGFRVLTAEDWLFIQGAKINEFIIEGGEVYRLLTAMFLHGGLTHLFFNGYALYVIGRNLEQISGHARFLLIYFLGGLTGSLFSLLFSQNPSVGASGAIFAIFGAELVFVYRHRKIFGRAAYQQLQSMIFMLALNVAIGLMPESNIDNWGHMGGFVGGLALAWLIGPMLRVSVTQVPLIMSGAPLPSAVELTDENPLQKRLYVPFMFAAAYVLILGVFLQTRG
ncbi:MAG: rhomboid family intramembrane serine protease [Anaerolineae bacterium]|nr:rhomboid family intramembrane serine protease [Anaerolineae bacterium]